LNFILFAKNKTEMDRKTFRKQLPHQWLH